MSSFCPLNVSVCFPLSGCWRSSSACFFRWSSKAFSSPARFRLSCSMDSWLSRFCLCPSKSNLPAGPAAGAFPSSLSCPRSSLRFRALGSFTACEVIESIFSLVSSTCFLCSTDCWSWPTLASRSFRFCVFGNLARSRFNEASLSGLRSSPGRGASIFVSRPSCF
jgi:hypothetical protein